MNIAKVLVIHPSLGLGGAEKIIAFVANSLSDDYNVTLLTLKRSKKTLELSEAVEEDYIDCYSESPIVGSNIVPGIKALLHMSRQIKEYILSKHFDLIICFDLRVLLAVYLSGINKHVKVLFSERADPYENPRYWAALLKHIYKRINYVVFQTEGAREFYGNSIFAKSNIILNPAFARIGFTDKRDWSNINNVIFAAGRFQKRKGFDLLIDAFSQIAKKYNDVQLIIYGEGEEKDNLKMQIITYNLQNRVELRDPINGVVEHNINSRMFVLPSRSEGIPNIVIEAMYYGIPCVISDCRPGGARLLSNNGEYCILAENDNANSIAESIEYALGNEKAIKQMAILAKESLKRFDENKIRLEWIHTVSRVLEGK